MVMTKRQSNHAPGGTDVVHQFQFSTEGVARCACGSWAISKIPMTPARAQRVARRYGKERLGPQADSILQHGLPFTPLTEDDAIRSWECHIRNLPDKRGQGQGNADNRKPATAKLGVATV